MKLRQYAPRLVMVMLTAALATVAVAEVPAAPHAVVEGSAEGPTAALRGGATRPGPSHLSSGADTAAADHLARGAADLVSGAADLASGTRPDSAAAPAPAATLAGGRPGDRSSAAGEAAPSRPASLPAPAAASVVPADPPPPTAPPVGPPAGPSAAPAGPSAAPPIPPGPAPTPQTTPGAVTGTVERVWADATPAAHSAVPEEPVFRTWLKTPQQRYRLAAGALEDVVPGSAVTATLGAGNEATGHPVVAVAGIVAPAQGEIDGVGIGPDTLLDFATLPAAVTHEFTVVLAVPAGARTDATTIEGFRDRVTGPVAGYWSTQSRGQRSIIVTAAHSWIQLASSCTGSPFDLWNEVAGKVGFSSGPRKHLLVYLPTAAGCGAGLGTVGPAAESGGLMWVSYNSTDVIAHEFGHNLGLGHSNGLLCPSSSDGVHSGGFTGGCVSHAYRDYYDVMGVSWGNIGSLSTVHADTLGFLSSSDKLTVTAPTRVRLAAVSGNGLRTAKINDPGGTYYVEYRPAQAGDAWLTGNWRGLDPGVLVRRVSPADSRESLLLDGSVSGGTRTDDWAAALVVGRTLTTASGRTSVTVESADGTGATVTVSVDGQSPPPPGGAPSDGAQVTFTAPANGASLSAGVTTFSGIATAPGGTLLWQVSQGSTVRASGSAATGGEGVFDTFSFPVSLPAGSYTVRAWVPDESDGEGTAMGTARFSSSLTVTVS